MGESRGNRPTCGSPTRRVGSPLSTRLRWRVLSKAGGRTGPMNIVVLVKQVPDTYSERKLTDPDHTLDRGASDAVIDEINERSVEAALRLKEAHGGEVTVVCVGPDRATEAIRKAFSMGADKA